MNSDLDWETLSLADLIQHYSEPTNARAFMEHTLWPNGPVCPHCQNDGKTKGIYKITPDDRDNGKRKSRPGLRKCGACRKQFTVTVGTVFESTHIPLSKWLCAIFILCSSKKSISSHQFHRMLGVTYKTAWFMAHRIRYIMAESGAKLTGTVEVDEAFIGGVGDLKTVSIRKTPVVALVQRGGKMKARVVSNVTQKNLRQIIEREVDKSAVINTDKHGAYRSRLKDFAGHNTVNHSKHEYTLFMPDGARHSVNCAESFFSLLKRGVMGSWHHVSREHLHRYCAEFEFRWNTRKTTDGIRFHAALPKAVGKRLKYREMV